MAGRERKQKLLLHPSQWKNQQISTRAARLILLIVFLKEDKLLKSTVGMDSLFQILMTCSVKKTSSDMSQEKQWRTFWRLWTLYSTTHSKCCMMILDWN